MARIVLVHGAWGQAAGWGRVPELLREAGHVAEAIDLPGHGADSASPGHVTLADYAAALVEVLEEGDGPSVLVGHSMGGMPISAAAELRPEGVSKVVYVAAFLPKDGDSRVALKTREPDTFGASILRGPERGTTVLDPALAADILFQDADVEQRDAGLSLLVPQPNAPQVDSVSLSAAGFGSVERHYIICLKDRTVTPWLQRQMVAESPCASVAELDAGHFPQLTQPAKLATAILGIV